MESDEKRSSLRGDFESAVRNKFLSTFGTSYSMERDMKVMYHYAKGVDVSVYLTENQDFLSPNYVWIDYSQPIHHQKRIVCRDKGESRIYRALNPDGCRVTQYQIDGCVIREASMRCDFLLMNEDKRNAYLIELKGSDIDMRLNNWRQLLKDCIMS